jgi:hypothetical protein
VFLKVVGAWREGGGVSSVNVSKHTPLLFLLPHAQSQAWYSQPARQESWAQPSEPGQAAQPGPPAAAGNLRVEGKTNENTKSETAHRPVRAMGTLKHLQASPGQEMGYF